MEELLKEEQDSLGLCSSQMMVSGTRGFKSVSGTKGKGSHPFAENGLDSVLSLGLLVMLPYLSFINYVKQSKQDKLYFLITKEIHAYF